jgi:Transposase DDE domain group 1
LRAFAPATAAMTDDTIPLFSFPAIEGKKVTAAFDGGRLSSDGGVMLLSMAERRLGVAQRLARCIPDRRDPSRIAHTIADMIRARVFAICCGYEDADDLDDGERLWTDLRVWAYRGEIVLVSGRASRRPDRLDLKPPGGWLPTYGSL